MSTWKIPPNFIHQFDHMMITNENIYQLLFRGSKSSTFRTCNHTLNFSHVLNFSTFTSPTTKQAFIAEPESTQESVSWPMLWTVLTWMTMWTHCHTAVFFHICLALTILVYNGTAVICNICIFVRGLSLTAQVHFDHRPSRPN